MTGLISLTPGGRLLKSCADGGQGVCGGPEVLGMGDEAWGGRPLYPSEAGGGCCGPLAVCLAG